ncbi:MAG: enoyl-CoA hydratase/isomerase family protein [Aureliella sp.]
MAELVIVETARPGMALLTLNRPDRRNALCIALLSELCEQIESLAADENFRVIVLRGAGPIFSAGLDLAEAADDALVEESASAVARAFQTLRTTRLIAIAAVHGGAYAGGAGLMAACDMAIGTHDTQICFPEARRGLLPALVCEVLRSKVRNGDLRELMLVGNAIDAERAQQIGLFQRVVDPEDLIATALKMADGILAGGPKTIEATKTLLNQTYAGGTPLSNPEMIDVHLQARRSAEAEEGLAAFLEKRMPRWLSS